MNEFVNLLQGKVFVCDSLKVCSVLYLRLFRHISTSAGLLSLEEICMKAVCLSRMKTET